MCFSLCDLLSNTRPTLLWENHTFPQIKTTFFQMSVLHKKKLHDLLWNLQQLHCCLTDQLKVKKERRKKKGKPIFEKKDFVFILRVHHSYFLFLFFLCVLKKVATIDAVATFQLLIVIVRHSIVRITMRVFDDNTSCSLSIRNETHFCNILAHYGPFWFV